MLRSHGFAFWILSSMMILCVLETPVIAGPPFTPGCVIEPHTPLWTQVLQAHSPYMPQADHQEDSCGFATASATAWGVTANGYGSAEVYISTTGGSYSAKRAAMGVYHELWVYDGAEDGGVIEWDMEVAIEGIVELQFAHCSAAELGYAAIFSTVRDTLYVVLDASVGRSSAGVSVDTSGAWDGLGVSIDPDIQTGLDEWPDSETAEDYGTDQDDIFEIWHRCQAHSYFHAHDGPNSAAACIGTMGAYSRSAIDLYHG